MSSRPLPGDPVSPTLSPASIALMSLLALLVLITGSVAAASLPRAPEAPFRVLVYSGAARASQGTVHAGVEAVKGLGVRNGFGVEATDDPAVFNDTDLARFHTVVFNNTAAAADGAGALDGAGRAALRRYIRAGGGWVGLHDASAGTGGWDWYDGLVGAALDRRTPVQAGRIEVLDHAHPSTMTLPDLWERTEEWLGWRTDPTPTVHTLARIRVRDKITGLGAGMDHPWSWCRNYDGGRSWFTAGGHAPSAFQDDAFLRHLLGGIEWAAGARPGDCTATQSRSFQRTPLAAGGLFDPVDMAVAPDRRVFVARRTGELAVVDQRTMRVSTALDLAYSPEAVARAGGLSALALDPDFAENAWLYLLRSDTTGGRLFLSRFTADGPAVDPASERRLLVLPGRRSTAGGRPPPSGSLAFDQQGRLYVATGDVTPSDAPDARSDLRGSVLRITPQDDGTYTVPEGNLHRAGTSGARPEIYATGLRDPFRVTVDPSSGTPLAAATAPDGSAEYLRIAGAGRVDGPYCAGDGAEAGAGAGCPRAGGAPPAVPVARGDVVAVSGSVYDYDPASLYRSKFPEYFDGKWLTYDPAGRHFTAHAFQRADQTFVDPRFGPVEAGGLQSVTELFGDMEWHRPVSAVLGPDGALYVVDSGLDGGTGRDGGNEGAGVFRIDHVGDGRLPGAGIAVDRDNGSAPLTVTFEGAGSGPAGRSRTAYAWDFDGDGGTDSTEANPSYTYRTEGRFTARLTVTGPEGTTAMAGQEITVGNTRPRITVHGPPDGGLFRPGDTLAFTVGVEDPEDGATSPVDCSRVRVRSEAGRAGPLRPLPGSPGCRGSMATVAGDASRSGAPRITVRYTDKGAPNAPALTGSTTLTVRRDLQEAEGFTATGGAHDGAVIGSRTHASGGRALTEIEDGDWISFDPVHLGGIRSVTVGATACGLGGTVSFRAGSPDGPLLGSLTVPGAGTGAGDVSPATALRDPGGSVRLYVVFTNSAWGSEDPDLFTVDLLRFHGPGAGRAGAGE
ncbi:MULTISPECIES: ThuA domain-containing protein [unclassified Streptomyces]|uniref:ThuA domain-containing protein n=1 Tax=unclassified Streptomyces TaxID=2593676 RepID=UPI0035DD993D